MRFPLISAILCAFLNPLAAQTPPVSFDTTFRLASKNPDADVDHATIAVNQYGDIFVAYHGINALDSELRHVEGMLVLRTQVQGWVTAKTDEFHYLLGDPEVGVYTAIDPINRDTCNKPDVCAMADGSFVITWPRHNRYSTAADSRLETARVECRDSIGELIRNATDDLSPILHTLAPGVGYPVGLPLIDKGEAGIMPDMVALASNPSACAVAYANHKRTVIQGHNTFQDYDIDIARLNWTQPGAPTIQGPITLEGDIPWDLHDALNPSIGGQILPDIVEDDDRNLVIAYEEYRFDGHPDPLTGVPVFVGIEFKGVINVKRFSGFAANPPLSELNHNEFKGVRRPSDGSSFPQRRPNLSTSQDDRFNTVSLAWIDKLNEKLMEPGVGYQQIEYHPNGSTTTIDFNWSNAPAREDSMPVPIHGPSFRGCLASTSSAVQPESRIRAFLPLSGRTILSAYPSIRDAFRPSATFLTDYNSAGQRVRDIVPICIEGKSPYAPFNVHKSIFLTIHEIP